MEQKSKKEGLGRKEKTILVTMIANMVLIALRFFLADLSGNCICGVISHKFWKRKIRKGCKYSRTHSCALCFPVYFLYGI